MPVACSRLLRKAALWLAVSSITQACSVYDGQLLGSQNGSVAQLDAAVAQHPSTLIDAGPPFDAGHTTPPDSVPDPDAGADNITRCGDGVVTGDEKCDLGIPAGQPGACPTSCDPLAQCVPRLLNGTGCQAKCELRPLVCEAGDGCCPGNCTADNDPDCSPTCGDGIIQDSRGETCEDGSDSPCKQSEADCDDADPCTLDTLSGSAANCNAACSHMPITDLKAGDGCCPSGANANTDGDCKPSCGNGVREGSEECDGTEGCTADCKLNLQPDQVQCLLTAGNDACKQCACKNCAATELACWGTDDATNNMLCAGMQACSRQTGCVLEACYCGASLALLCLNPTGPCKMQVEATAGTTDPGTINQMIANTDNPLGRAYAADNCRLSQCQDVCR